MKVYGIVMAGGSGTRFWPLSTKRTPKQLLNLSGKNLMVNEAIDRLSLVTSHKNIFVVTSQSQYSAMVKAVEGRISSERVLSEPAARNTSACIGYAAMEIIKKYGDGIMVITPSDAFIKDEESFATALRRGIEAAEDGDKLITIGIKPTFPATGYGYIRHERKALHINKVLSFKEKPDLPTAEEYFKSGEYVWNSGMFIWRASLILEKFKEFLPDIYTALVKIGEDMGTQREAETLSRVYPAIPSVSIDYGVMEKADNIFTVSGEFGWNDVASFDMMGVMHPADENGNVKIGKNALVNVNNSVVYSTDRLIACVDIKDLVVVETEKVVMVCPKDKVQDVKKLVEMLKSDGKEEYL